MTVLPTSDEYYLKPRWFWAQSALGDAQTYALIRATIYDAALGQPWVGVSGAQAGKERCYAIGYYQDMWWPTSPFFDVWVAGHGFRCQRFLKGVVAVCTNGVSLGQVLVIECSSGPRYDAMKPPAPVK